jgi:hypothetical protein
MESDDFRDGDYLLPEGCKDLIDFLKLKLELKPELQWRKRASNLPPICGKVVIPAETSASQLAALLKKQPLRIIADVMQLGVSVTIDQQLDFWIILIVARRHGFIAERADPQPQPSDLCAKKSDIDMEPRKKRVLAQLGKRAVYRAIGHLVPVTIEAISGSPDYFSAELVAIDGISLSHSKERAKLPCRFSVGAQWQLLTEGEGQNKWTFAVGGCCWRVFLDEAKCDEIVRLCKKNTEMDSVLLFKLANAYCIQA